MSHNPQAGDVVWRLRPGDDEPVEVIVDEVDRNGAFVAPLQTGLPRYTWSVYLYRTKVDALEGAVRRASKSLADLQSAVDSQAERLAGLKARLAQAKDQPR